MIQMLSPPFPLSASHPQLAEIMMEMVRMRVSDAGVHELAQAGEISGDVPPSSEQSTFVLAMVDALPFLLPGVVEEWLTMTAVCMNEILDERMRDVVKVRFCDLLTNGEMDPSAPTSRWPGGERGAEAGQ